MKDFKIKEVKREYSGRVVSLSVETIVLPGGRETIREVVEHPGAVAIVPMVSPLDVILIQQFRYCTRKTIWEIPAGTIELGETPGACAGRELIEETGYRAGNITPLGGFYTSPGFCNEFLHLFLATDLEPCESRPDTDEVLEVHRMTLDEALTKVERGEIVDAKTIVGLMRVSRMGPDTITT